MSDEAFELSAGPGWVQLGSFTSQQLDLDLHSRVRLQRYPVEGGRLRRLAPLSDSAAGFLAEWQQLPWAEPSRWSAPGLAKVHSQLERALRGSDCLGSFVERKRAVAGPPRWRLGLAFEDGAKACGLPPKLSFEVSLKEGAFYLEAGPAEAAPDGWQREE